MKLARSSRFFLLLAAAVVSSAAGAASARLGFSVAVETDGFFSKTLKQVKIASVVAGAPAEQAGLRAGDEVVSINDTPIAGASGPRIMDIVHGVQPGGHLKLKVLRTGAERVVDIVGGASD
jgi:C-terminal processing protease CtpA/Prc